MVVVPKAPKFHKIFVAPAGPENCTDKGAQPPLGLAEICADTFVKRPRKNSTTNKCFFRVHIMGDNSLFLS
jgi:hypothetical protein